MKHCVILKLNPGVSAEEVQRTISRAYARLDDALDWVNHPVVYRCCGKLENGADILSEIEVEGEENLRAYLEHPLTSELAKALKGAIAEKITFEHY